LKATATILPNNDPQQVIHGLNRQEIPALKIIYSLYYRNLCFYLSQIVGDTHTAEEIADDTFLKLWNEAPGNPFLSLEGVWAFLRLVSRNAAIDHLRKTSTQKRHISGYLSSLSQEDLTEQLDYSAVWTDVIAQLYLALEALPGQQREVMRLKQAGFKTDEIAVEMNLSRQTVRNYVRLALASLKGKLPDIALALLLCHPVYGQIFW